MTTERTATHARSTGRRAAARTSSCCPRPTPSRLAKLPRELPAAVLRPGTVLWRVHDAHVRCDAFLEPDSDPEDPRHGGRFDPLPGAPTGVLYAASSADAALGETLVHVDPRGVARPDGLAEAHERALSRLRVVRPLRVVRFCGLDLHRFPLRNRHLTECGKADYPGTRAWAAAFRRLAPRTQGIAWVSRQDNTACSYVFWEDRVRPGDLEPVGRALSLGSRAGRARVREVLERTGVAATALRTWPLPRAKRS